jgi:thioredoxin 1
VDFWAEWCGPCRAIAPLIDELGESFNNTASIGKVNVDSESDISAEYGITSIPTLLFFKDGKVVDKHIGNATKSQLEEKLNSLI